MTYRVWFRGAPHGKAGARVLELRHFSRGWFTFVDANARELGPFERWHETIDYMECA